MPSLNDRGCGAAGRAIRILAQGRERARSRALSTRERLFAVISRVGSFPRRTDDLDCVLGPLRSGAAGRRGVPNMAILL